MKKPQSKKKKLKERIKHGSYLRYIYGESDVSEWGLDAADEFYAQAHDSLLNAVSEVLNLAFKQPKGCEPVFWAEMPFLIGSPRAVFNTKKPYDILDIWLHADFGGGSDEPTFVLNLRNLFNEVLGYLRGPTSDDVPYKENVQAVIQSLETLVKELKERTK